MAAGVHRRGARLRWLGVAVAAWATLSAGAAAADPGQEAAEEAAAGDARLAATTRAGAWESLRTRETLSGDWGGWRTRLAERGVTLGIAYTGDVVGIAAGGVHRRTEYLMDWDLTLTVDSEPLFGWRGGRLFLYGLGLWSTGSPSENAGDIQALDNIDAPNQWKLYEAWLQQEMLDGRFSLLAGVYDVNGEFDVLETATLFVNSSFGIGKDFSQSGENGPSIFPATALGLRLDAHPVANGYARIAVLDGAPGGAEDSRMDPDFFAFSSDDGVLCVAEVGYLAGADEGSEDPYSKIALGGWFYSAEVDRIASAAADGTGDRRSGNHGMYLLGERVVYREPRAPQRGLTAFVRLGFADSEVNAVGGYAGGGAVYTGPFPARPQDRLGLGVAAAMAGHDFEQASEAAGVPVDGAEVAIELTYQMPLTPWLSLQPDLQYIVNPGFADAVRDALALGIRVEIAF